MRTLGYRVYSKQHDCWLDTDENWSLSLQPDGQLWGRFDNEDWMHLTESEGFFKNDETGLKDKNGVEKYQDDIVRTNGVDGELLWRIVWSELDVLSGFDYEPIGHSFSSVHNRVDEDGEVIGDIHENLELLEAKS